MNYSYTAFFRNNITRNKFLAACLSLLVPAMMSSCEKDKEVHYPATVTIFNGLDNNTHVYANLSDKRPAVFGNVTPFEVRGTAAGYFNLHVSQFPQPIEFYAVTDTFPESEPIIKTVLDLKPGGIYTLFLHEGNAKAAYKLVTENMPPVNRTDSSFIVRFANFSSTQTISVNLKGEPNGSFISQIPAASLSEFRELRLNMTTHPGYEFEIRDQATGNLLGTRDTYTQSSGRAGGWLFRLHTFVLAGHEGAAIPNNMGPFVISHQ